MQTNETIFLKRLSEKEVSDIYESHTIHDFPEEERKPLSSILNLMQRNIYLCYGLFEKQELRAYAYFIVNQDLLMLDYFAVCRQYRNGGYGSRFLSLLKRECSDFRGVILEVESPDYAADERSFDRCNRRIRFYQRNGVMKTKVTSCTFDVEYDIMYLPCRETCSDEQVGKELLAVYQNILSPKMFREKLHVRFPGPTC